MKNKNGGTDLQSCFSESVTVWHSKHVSEAGAFIQYIHYLLPGPLILRELLKQQHNNYGHFYCKTYAYL